MFRSFLTDRRMLYAAAAFLLTFEGAPLRAQTTRGFKLTGPPGAVQLAELHFSNGNVVQFIGTADGDEVYYAETTPAGPDESFLFGDKDVSPMERYLALTPDYVAVPRMLVDASSKEAEGPAEAGDAAVAAPGSTALEVKAAPQPGPEPWREALSRRTIVERLTSPVYVPLSTLKIAPHAAATNGGSCGPDGANYFKTHHCGTWDWHGYGKGEGYCYNGAYSWIQKTSSKTMRVTYSRTAACGAGATTTHLRKKVGGWDTAVIGISAPNTVTTFWSTRTGIAWKRRTRFDNHDGGFVRGWVHYFKQVTQ